MIRLVGLILFGNQPDSYGGTVIGSSLRLVKHAVFLFSHRLTPKATPCVFVLLMLDFLPLQRMLSGGHQYMSRKYNKVKMKDLVMTLKVWGEVTLYAVMAVTSFGFFGTAAFFVLRHIYHLIAQ